MTSRRALQLCLALAVGFTVATAQAVPTAHLVLDGVVGDWISGGQDADVTYTPELTDLFAAQVRRGIFPDGTTTYGGAPGSEPAELLFLFDLRQPYPLNHFALLFFGTDGLGIPITTGHYTDAQRADFAAPGHPGLDVSFDHRGCNMVSGEFTISQLAFSDAARTATGSPVESFAASFSQNCEGFMPTLHGTFTYYAFPEVAAVPEPTSTALLAVALGAFWCGGRRRRSAAEQ